MVAREGSISKASVSLNLTAQTISGQIKLLEDAIGEPLFHRVGRGLTLTNTGHIVNQYADEIFNLGGELAQRIKSDQLGFPVILSVGIVNSIAKLITYRILQPIIGKNLEEPVRLVCKQGDIKSLMADIAVHRLDLVISDCPIPPDLHVKAYNHSLGESSISFFAHKDIVGRYTNNFPQSLKNARFLLPSSTTPLRRALDDWFERSGITPDIVAEFDDSGLLKAFGEAGGGIFPAPSVIAKEIRSMYSVEELGYAEGLRERYYAISPERKIRHPSIELITKAARAQLFV